MCMSVLISKPVNHLSVSTGISDYKELREEGFAYIDKTMFIARMLDNPNKAMLIPRPRRFGKTLNMSMLKYFFEIKSLFETKKEDKENEKNEGMNIIERAKRQIVNGRAFNRFLEMFSLQPVEHTTSQKKKNLSGIFEDTAIWTAKNGFYQKHFQQYPVVFLNFKDITDTKWEEAWSIIKNRILNELERLDEKYHILSFSSQNRTKNLIALSQKNKPFYFKEFLGNLVFLLHKITGKKVIILIDEYDAPLLTAHENGYWKDAVNFFKPFLSNGFKEQEFLFKGVITGILKIAKESIFSGMNNLDVCTILSHKFHSDFGFTEYEVEELLQLTNQTENHSTIKDWYNGYRFENGSRGAIIYNPWSILKYVENSFDNENNYAEAYWLGTSSNTLIRKLLRGQIAKYGEKINSLLNLNSEKNCIVTEINKNLELKLLHEDETALWSLLLFSGYLTVKKKEKKGNVILYHVCIPNKEVYSFFRFCFHSLSQNWKMT